MLRPIPMALVYRASLTSLLAGACMSDNPGFGLLEEFGSGVEATGSSTGSTAGSETGAGSTAGSGTDAATSDVSTSDISTSEMSTSNISTSDMTTDVSASDGSSTGGACVPMTPCFTGLPATLNVGGCHGGLSTCTPEGELAACEGEVVPHLDPCDTPEDEDCNGSNEDCAECIPAQVAKCYTGPDGTEGVGICVGGTKQCTDMGTFGPCVGEVKPMLQENCDNKLDDDCDAQANEGC